MDQALNQKIDAYIAQNKEQLLKDIAALVAVLSPSSAFRNHRSSSVSFLNVMPNMRFTIEKALETAKCKCLYHTAKNICTIS